MPETLGSIMQAKSLAQFECLESRNPPVWQIVVECNFFTCITFYYFCTTPNSIQIFVFIQKSVKPSRRMSPVRSLEQKAGPCYFFALDPQSQGNKRAQCKNNRTIVFVLVFKPSKFGGSWRWECEVPPHEATLWKIALSLVLGTPKVSQNVREIFQLMLEMI